MNWREIDSREYLRVHRSYTTLRINTNSDDEMVYCYNGKPVLRATNMRAYPRYWIPSDNDNIHHVVHSSRNDIVPPSPQPRQPIMSKPVQPDTPAVSKKDQAIDILIKLKQDSTLKRSTAIKKFQDELGVSPAYAATLWQKHKDSV